MKTILQLCVCFLVTIILFTGINGCANEDEAKPPAAPSGITASALSESQLTVHWTDNSYNEQGFELFERAGDSGAFAQVASLPNNVTGATVTDRQSGTKYYYTVRAYNGAGGSSFSDTTAAVELVNVRPDAPDNFRAVVQNQTDILLTWRDNSEIESGFKLYDRVGSNTGYDSVVTLNSDTTSFLVLDRASLTQYQYRISAFNQVGESGFDSSGIVTTGEPQVILDIWVAQDPPEHPINVNIPILGRVTTIHGTSLHGVKVYFVDTPDDLGNITPFSTTEPDSANGFGGRVIFYPISPGQVKIRAYVLNAQEVEVAADSEYVQIYRP